MNTYDEKTNELLVQPDLSVGYTYPGTHFVAHHDATEEKFHWEVMKGTENFNNGKGWRGKVVDEPAKEAWDEYEDCLIYHLYTDEEKKEILSNKISELSDTCNRRISNGMDVTLSDGSRKHFTYSLEDQSNISNMYNAVLMGATQFPYHSGGEPCKVYSAKDIVTIYATLSAFTTSQTTYHNMLKQYTESLDKVPDIEAVEYGQELTGEYLENYNEMLNVANEQMQIVLSKASQYSV